MSTVVTTLEIDADTAGADKFSQAIDRVTGSSQDGISSARNLGLAIAGVGAAGLAAIAGVNSVVDAIVKANKSLADMQTLAKQVGLSLADIQGIKFGGAILGIDEKTLNAGLQQSAKLLNDASRNSNSLSKELEANGLSVKNANGQLITQNQLLGIAADLIKRARNPGDANAIAEMLGLSREWLPLLEQGKEAMSRLTTEARAAGAIIDDETVKRAVEFDAAWRKSTVTFEANMKAALLSLLPFVDDLIERMARFIKSIDRVAIEKHADDALKAIEENTGIPREGGIRFGMTPETEAALKEFQSSSTSIWGQIVAAATVLSSLVERIPGQDVKWHGGTPPVRDTSDAAMGAAKNAAAWLAEGEAWKKLSDDVVSGADKMVGGFSKVAAKDVANDAVDRAINTLRRHIEQQKADTEAVGLGDGALARFRAQAAETAAVQANGGKETEEQRKQFEKLKDEAFATADALARAKVASQIDFSSKTKFLSSDDVALAQQLRGIYGNDVPKALASTEAAQLRVIAAQKGLGDGFKEVGQSMFTAFVTGKNVMDAMVQSLDNLAKKLSDKAFENILSGILSGDPAQAAIGVAQAGVSALITAFTGDQKAKAELQKAQAAWHDMAGQVANFNLAAKGFNLGPLTSELQSLFSTVETLQKAAQAAHDRSGEAQAAAMFNSSVERIFKQFKEGNQALTPLQQQLKSVNDEAEGLKETLLQISPGFKGFADQVDSIKQGQINDVVAKFHDTFISGLTSRLNSAKGQGFLNDTANLLLAHAQDLASVKDLGNDPTLLSQVAATFRAEAQKIVDGAELLGPAFADFTTQFPMLKDVVHEFVQSTVDDSKALQDAINGRAKTILNFVNDLNAGPGSTDSPLARRASAGSIFNSEFALAQSGDTGAASRITQDAQNLLDAERAISASGEAFQQLKASVTSQLLGLPDVQNTTDPSLQVMRDVLKAITDGNSTQAKDTTLGTLLTKQQLSDLGVATNARVDLLLTASQLAEQKLATDAVAKGILTKAQVVDLGLSTDSTTKTLLTNKQLTDLGLATDTKVGALLTSQQLADAKLAADTTVATLLTQAQLAEQGLAKDDTTGRVALSTAQTQNYTSAYLPNISNQSFQLPLTRNAVEGGNTFLTSMNTFSNRIIQALNEQGAMQAGNFGSMILNGKLLLNWMPQLVYGGPGSKAAGQDGGGTASVLPYSSHATGGVIPAHGLGLVSEHLNPTFVRAGNEPITVSPFPAQIPFRPGNDNGGNAALIAEIRELRKELAEVKKTVAAGSNGIIQTTYEAGEKGAQATKAGAETVKSEISMRRRAQR